MNQVCGIPTRLNEPLLMARKTRLGQLTTAVPIGTSGSAWRNGGLIISTSFESKAN